MCLNGLIGLVPARASQAGAPTPSATLIEHLGLEAKTAAEVEELFSHAFVMNEAGTLVISEQRVARETLLSTF
jgi:hypothetical protein